MHSSSSPRYPPLRAPRAGARARRGALAAGLALLAVVLAGCTSAPTTTSPSTGSQVLFYDGFSGKAGASANSKYWSNATGGTGNGNQELEYNTAGTANAALDGDGDLAITAKKQSDGKTCWYGACQYTSARLVTAGKYSAQYGRVEARIKMPSGMGIWPAFWMLGKDIDTDPWPGAGEIDIMENIGSEPSTVHGSLHGPGYSSGNQQTSTDTLASGQKFSDSFHTFAIDWSPDKIEFLVDGTVYETQTASTVGTNSWVFNKPFTILLDLAVGGNYPGDPDSSTPFPGTMLVDYVAVYKLKS